MKPDLSGLDIHNGLHISWDDMTPTCSATAPESTVEAVARGASGRRGAGARGGMTLRLDDLGASSKEFERHSHRRGFDWGPFKTSWGPYREMTAVELDRLFRLVAARRRTIIVAITACWVESTGVLTPYPAKYPEQATVIQRWVRTGTVEVANHGLTHCQVGWHLPGFFGNRRYHREFLDDMPEYQLIKHLEQSQQTFRTWLGRAPRVLVPPGGMFPDWGIPVAKLWGLDLWSEPCEVFHDRDFVKGDGWERLEALCASA